MCTCVSVCHAKINVLDGGGGGGGVREKVMLVTGVHHMQECIHVIPRAEGEHRLDFTRDQWLEYLIVEPLSLSL